MDQKMIKILGGVIGAFVLLILILFLFTSCTNKVYTYETLEAKMVEVARSHYEQNPDDLPSDDKDSKTLTLKKMITAGYIEEVVELFNNENAKCDGNVTVTNNNGFYLYTPYLSCSGIAEEDYESKYLTDVIIETSLVETGVGLYENGDKYVYRGEVDNNYVSWNDKEFRIIGINADGTLRLLEGKGLERITWDDRYNEDLVAKLGFNEYYYNDIDSRMKATLEEYYDNSKVWTDDMKAYITTQDVCIGKRLEDTPGKDGVIECSSKVENQVFSLFTAYEYLDASLDPLCVKTSDKNCQNYNWIAKLDQNIWTVTADSETSFEVFQINDYLNSTAAFSPANANVVFNVVENVIYAGGTGTKDDPYLFR